MNNENIINITPLKLEDICWACGGSGKLKAMQSAMTYDAGFIRAKDTTVKCPYCKGTGFRREQSNGRFNYDSSTRTPRRSGYYRY